MKDSDSRLVHKHFESWVVVGDEHTPLPQFGVEYQEAINEASAWIPSEAGQKFAVCYRKVAGRDTDKYSFREKLYLDGHKVDSGIHRSSSSSTKMVSFMEISPTEIRDFMFNSAVLTDDDNYMDDPLSAGIGEIKLVLQLATIKGDSPLPHGPRRFKEPPKTKMIHERSKKGLVHQIKLSESKTRPSGHLPGRRLAVKRIGRSVTFIFKYRSFEMLQANGIAPRPTPPAEPAEDDSLNQFPQASREKSTSDDASHVIPIPGVADIKREDEDLNEGTNDDDDDEIAIRERELMAELEKVRAQKRARKDIASQPAKKVKTEPACHFTPGEVIDLTEGPELSRPQKRVKTEATTQLALGEVIDLT